MIYNAYASTGIKVSAIGFGGMRFPINDGLDRCASLVSAAYDSGINYFDTAPTYEKSEEIFGLAFKEMNKTRNQMPFYVSTKTSKSEPAEIRKNLETSLTRMNLDHIDFYHVWQIMSLDDYRKRKAAGVLAEFEHLKSEGLIKHICVSTHMPGPDIGEMLRDYPFDGVLLGYSVMNFAYREAAIEAAANLNCAVAIMNPLGGGIIPNHPDRFAFVKTQPAETVVEAALRFLINDPGITISLVGFSHRNHIAEAIFTVDGFKPISPAAVEKIRSSLQTSFNELCTSCRYCEGKCPQGIPVLRVMDAYNQYALLSSMEMINRLRWHWEIALKDNCLDQCTECKRCEDACTQKLPICERLKFIRSEIEKFLKSENAS